MTTLSYSSSVLIGACEAKYHHYKLLKTKRDYPFETSRALVVGKVFHETCEDLKHQLVDDETLEKIVSKKLLDYEKENSESLSYFPIAFAMVKKYLSFFDMMPDKVVAVEYEIKTDDFLGYIDVILQEPDGRWYVADLKTKARFDVEKNGPLLYKDIQLHLYSSYFKEIAAKFKLDPTKFGGFKYLVTKTPLIRQKKGETRPDFLERLYQSIETMSITIPYNQNSIDLAKNYFKSARAKMEKLESGVVPVQNFGECINTYGNICAWYSQCHGKKHEDVKVKCTSFNDLNVDI